MAFFFFLPNDQCFFFLLEFLLFFNFLIGIWVCKSLLMVVITYNIAVQRFHRIVALKWPCLVQRLPMTLLLFLWDSCFPPWGLARGVTTTMEAGRNENNVCEVSNAVFEEQSSSHPLLDDAWYVYKPIVYTSDTSNHVSSGEQ